MSACCPSDTFLRDIQVLKKTADESFVPRRFVVTEDRIYLAPVLTIAALHANFASGHLSERPFLPSAFECGLLVTCTANHDAV